MAYLAAAFLGALYIAGTAFLALVTLCMTDGIVAKVKKLRRQWNR